MAEEYMEKIIDEALDDLHGNTFSLSTGLINTLKVDFKKGMCMFLVVALVLEQLRLQ